MEQLHDIEGLDPIGFWPPAIGWWAVAMIVLAGVIAIVVFLCRRIAFKRSWRYPVLRQLRELENDLLKKNTGDIAVALSAYLRRIAVHRYSRDACAGLTGRAWLKWLAKHDPKRFDWESKGRLLIEAPYAPPHLTPATEEIRELIQAVKRWVS
ncbi:MAG: DUF4381 domain-containing protein [Waddliaceae bacterium]